MATQVKTTEIMLPRRNEYVRGSVKRDNLVRIATAFTGSDWPGGLPPIEVHAMDRLRPSTRTTGRSCTPARPAGQDGEIQPVGGSRPVHVDVRLAAAPWPRNVRELETLLLNPWTRKVLVAANLEALTRAFVVSPTGFEPVFPD